jgi:hypothetical protein
MGYFCAINNAYEIGISWLGADELLP